MPFPTHYPPPSDRAAACLPAEQRQQQQQLLNPEIYLHLAGRPARLRPLRYHVPLPASTRPRPPAAV